MSTGPSPPLPASSQRIQGLSELRLPADIPSCHSVIREADMLISFLRTSLKEKETKLAETHHALLHVTALLESTNSYKESLGVGTETGVRNEILSNVGDGYTNNSEKNEFRKADTNSSLSVTVLASENEMLRNELTLLSHLPVLLSQAERRIVELRSEIKRKEREHALEMALYGSQVLRLRNRLIGVFEQNVASSNARPQSEGDNVVEVMENRIRNVNRQVERVARHAVHMEEETRDALEKTEKVRIEALKMNDMKNAAELEADAFAKQSVKQKELIKQLKLKVTDLEAKLVNMLDHQQAAFRMDEMLKEKTAKLNECQKELEKYIARCERLEKTLEKTKKTTIRRQKEFINKPKDNNNSNYPFSLTPQSEATIFSQRSRYPIQLPDFNDSTNTMNDIDNLEVQKTFDVKISQQKNSQSTNFMNSTSKNNSNPPSRFAQNTTPILRTSYNTMTLSSLNTSQNSALKITKKNQQDALQSLEPIIKKVGLSSLDEQRE